ncbi:MAG: efflux RND transporter permease subunit [Acidobacteriota bacterium]|nr:efflux RND transporter permease subunit [Acidobacteriota bacterium]
MDPLAEYAIDLGTERVPYVLVIPRVMEQGQPVDASNEVSIYGEDRAKLQVAAKQVTALLRDIQGTRSVRHNLGQGIPTVRFSVDDAIAGRHQLSRDHVAKDLPGQPRGLPAGWFRQADDPVPIVVRSGEGEQVPFAKLGTLDASRPGGAPVPLGKLAQFAPEWLPAVIHHFNGERMVTVSAGLNGENSFDKILAVLNRQMKATEFPENIFQIVGALLFPETTKYLSLKRKFMQFSVLLGCFMHRLSSCFLERGLVRLPDTHVTRANS